MQRFHIQGVLRKSAQNLKSFLTIKNWSVENKGFQSSQSNRKFQDLVMLNKHSLFVIFRNNLSDESPNQSSDILQHSQNRPTEDRRIKLKMQQSRFQEKIRQIKVVNKNTVGTILRDIQLQR